MSMSVRYENPCSGHAKIYYAPIKRSRFCVGQTFNKYCSTFFLLLKTNIMMRAVLVGVNWVIELLLAVFKICHSDSKVRNKKCPLFVIVAISNVLKIRKFCLIFDQFLTYEKFKAQKCSI